MKPVKQRKERGMFREKYYRRELMFDDLWDPGAVEAWLEHRAAEGWMLEKAGTWFARFRRCEPVNCRIRCELTAEKTLSLETVDTYGLSGWQYLCGYRNRYRLWRCDDPDAPELYTDPVAQSFTCQQQRQRLRRISMICLPLAALIAVIWILLPLLAMEQPVEYVLHHFGATHAVQAGWCVYMLILGIRARRTLRRMEQTLAAGIPQSHGGNWRRHRRRAIAAAWVYWLALAAILLLIPAERAMYQPAASQPGPYVPVTKLSEDDSSAAGRVNLDNHSLLAPLYCTVYDRDDRDCWATALYDQVRFPFLAEKLLRERMDWYAAGNGCWQRVEDPRFDQAYLSPAGEAGVQAFLARRDDQVLLEYTNCPADLEDFLDEFAEVLDRYQ